MSHGAWAWAHLTPFLERGGHRAVAIDLPGHGRRAHERRHASVETYARAVADGLVAAGFDRAIVVGHSMAGAVIQRLAELVPARVAHLVFLAAIVVPIGSTMLETQIPVPNRPLLLGLARAGDGAVLYPAAMRWARWLGDLAPGDDRVAHALASMTPQPIRPWLERVDLRRFYALDAPRTYVRCLRDAAIPPDRAAEYAARLGVVPRDLDCAHEPMLSQPERLAALLQRI